MRINVKGDIAKFNLKPQFIGRKVMLISSKVLDENEPYIYEHFYFSQKKDGILL